MNWFSPSEPTVHPGVAPGECYVYFDLQLARGWIALTVDDSVDAGRWALEILAERAGLAAGDPRLQVAATSLAAAVMDARSKPRGVVNRALAYQPDPLGWVLARVEVTLLAFGAKKMSLDDVAEEITDPTDVVGTVAVESRDLDAGPALRVRRIMALEPPEPGQDGAQPLVESLTYAVLPVGLPGLLMVHGEWIDLTMGDVLAAQVDDMVSALILDFRQ